ncbi:MAG: NAD(+) diphosphatase [Synergistaceae bacterium]|nr:NAD(+) diphosphatase [Synergistaceae bacterium]
MLVFCKDKILCKGTTCNLTEDYVLSRGNMNILRISRDLPAVWQADHPWVDVDGVERLALDERLLTMREFLNACDDSTRRIVTRAWQFRNWFRDVKFCSHCGGKLSPSTTDFGRKCDECGAMFYAPLSPAVITAVEHKGRLLLAHNTAWHNDRYSVIAGFVEPGETLEEAVRREIREEVAIEVNDVKYFGSQPWPFPNSLMFGFTAKYASGELKPDGTEISSAGFCSPEDIRRMNLPDNASIARKLIENFLRNH